MSPRFMQGGWPSNHRGDFPTWVWMLASLYPAIIGMSGLMHDNFVGHHTTLWIAADIQSGPGEPIIGAMLWIAAFCVAVGYLSDTPLMALVGCWIGSITLAILSGYWGVWGITEGHAGLVGVTGMVIAWLLLLGLSPSAWRRRQEKELASLAPRRHE